MEKLISRIFYFLFFLVPLAFWPTSSEVFEFNKMVLVYGATVIITSAWLFRCLAAKKFIFKRTILDIPILLFLATLTISTIFSIDIRTSILGYYSRFNGGLLSDICYALLYWAFVSNFPAEKIKKLILITLASALIVSTVGFFEHYGYFLACAPLNSAEGSKFLQIFKTNCWEQDVKTRVFSTMGQPNWLAAWLVALMPLTWAFGLSKKYKAQSTEFWLGSALSVLFFAVLLFTKSRSGLLGFLVADIFFWLLAFLREKRKALSSFLIHNSLFLILAFTIGTPFTNKPIVAPETGGTESGEIRKIVWKGTIDLWKRHPLLGTGPETFAYSYFETRAMEHNLVSEWNFLYNKAHNEYLNFAATTGTAGLLTYLVLIGAMILQLFRSSRNSSFLIHNSLLAGFASILVTNFFGFSVVGVSLLFFMFPAFASTLAVESREARDHRLLELNNKQRVFLLFLLLTLVYSLYTISKYWYSDFLYAKGKGLNGAGDFISARRALTGAVRLSPHEAVFWGELSSSSVEIAIKLTEAGEKEKGTTLAKIALSETEEALVLSPRNLQLYRRKIANLVRLAGLDPSYLRAAKEAAEKATFYAPTDASLYYTLALTTSRLGQTKEALVLFDKTIGMKPNYRNARFAKALILIELGRRQEAKEELTYILEKIDPNDNLARQELEKI